MRKWISNRLQFLRGLTFIYCEGYSIFSFQRWDTSDAISKLPSEGDSMFHYKAFGIPIQSTFLLPELLPNDQGSEVLIRYGETPDEIANVQSQGVCYQSNREEFLLNIGPIGKFFVSKGKEIVVKPNANASENDVRLFLMTSPFGALLHQRKLFPLHGSAIATKQGGVIFVGDSGVGKSTLAGAFYKRSYPILTDDICVVSSNGENKPAIQPGIPHLKLWADALKQLDIDPASLRRTRGTIERYYVNLNGQFRKDPIPLSKIVILESVNTDSFECTPVTGMEKFNTLSYNTYRFKYLEGLKSEHFRYYTHIAQHAKVYCMKRPKKPFLLDELVDKIEKDVIA